MRVPVELLVDMVVDRSDPPVPEVADALLMMPGWSRADDSDVRDAVLSTWRAMTNQAWASHGRSIMQTASPRYAAGPWLDFWGRLLGRARTVGEPDGPYRDRLLADHDVVSPDAITAVVAGIVAETSSTRFEITEPTVDCAYAVPTDNSAPYTCWVQAPAQRLFGSGFDTEAAAAGACYAVPIASSGLFWVILSGNIGNVTNQAHCWNLDASCGPYDFSSNDPGQFGFIDRAGDSLFGRIISEVESRKGGGTIWMMFTDPYLNGAL